MTVISNLNVVVQQGSTARDTQNIRQQTQDLSQAVATAQPEKNREQMTTVQHLNESEGAKVDPEKSSRKEEEKKKKKNKDTEKSTDLKAAEHDPDAPGQLLDVEA